MSSTRACLTVEGSLIGAELLDEIASGKAPGQKPADFNLDTRHLTDEIAAAWTDARAFWSAFQRQLARPNKNETGLTRDQWLIPLLRLLGYEISYSAKAAEVDGVSYAISHRAGADEDAPPLHLVGWQQSLDRRAESGRPRLSPHALMQEYLNRTEHLWGVIANGQSLRLLRDSQLIRRQSYIEFDLRQMMEAEKFAEFGLLFRLLHRTRLPRGMADAKDCLLEQYHQQTIEQGGRVRDKLRAGVEQALKLFANALLQHKKNTRLKEQLNSGAYKAEDFYQQLLRLIYRLLFLMVGEERDLLKASADADTRTYRENYSVERLRRLLHVRAAANDYEDLWLGLQSLFKIFQDEKLAEILNVSPLNGDLFDTGLTRLLEDTRISNRDLLTALWSLAMYQPDGRSSPQRVNYRELDVEELGSVYEGLLDYHPVITERNCQLGFDLVPGTERKDTGSYYTPPELVAELIESALVPVIEDRLDSARSIEEKKRALLSIKVCDPACGSGHFLLAAARRLGKELARIKSGEDEPTPDEQREATRIVIGECVYGVDKNPLAVDLCKVALWIEGNARGKPLKFIDHRIRCGDSLVGVLDLSVLREGIPDEAFAPVAGDDKTAAKEIKQRNRREREGQRALQFSAVDELHTLTDERRKFLVQSDETVPAARLKKQLHDASRTIGTKLYYDEMRCDLWTAAFFLELNAKADREHCIPTTEALHDVLERPNAAYPPLVAACEAAAQRWKFFHWPVEFHEVFEQGGFDVVLGNPPFLGGLKISGTLGEKYRHYLAACFAPFSGMADLCAGFYRRAFGLLNNGKRFGMVATNTLGQGDSRTSGLGFILRKSGQIHFARRFIKWPGTANVEVNLLVIGKGGPVTEPYLDGQLVDYISSRLDAEPEAESIPLYHNADKAFQGDILRGIGFVLEPEEAEALIDADSRNAECLFHYLNGEDLNSHPEQKPSRQVICFRDWELKRAQQYPNLLDIVESRVKPEREKLARKSDRNDREYWWRFCAYRQSLRSAIAPLSRVLVRSRVSELHSIAFVPQRGNLQRADDCFRLRRQLSLCSAAIQPARTVGAT